MSTTTPIIPSRYRQLVKLMRDRAHDEEHVTAKAKINEANCNYIDAGKCRYAAKVLEELLDADLDDPTPTPSKDYRDLLDRIRSQMVYHRAEAAKLAAKGDEWERGIQAAIAEALGGFLTETREA